MQKVLKKHIALLLVLAMIFSCTINLSTSMVYAENNGNVYSEEKAETQSEHLWRLVQEAKALDPKDYTKESYETFMTLIPKANSKEDIDKNIPEALQGRFITMIEDGKKNLEESSLAHLWRLVQEAKTLDPKDYTKESYDAYISVVPVKAQSRDDIEQQIPEQVRGIFINKIEEAKAQLKKNETPRQQLWRLIQEARALDPADYTPESYEAFMANVPKAKQESDLDPLPDIVIQMQIDNLIKQKATLVPVGEGTNKGCVDYKEYTLEDGVYVVDMVAYRNEKKTEIDRNLSVLVESFSKKALVSVKDGKYTVTLKALDSIQYPLVGILNEETTDGHKSWKDFEGYRYKLGTDSVNPKYRDTIKYAANQDGQKIKEGITADNNKYWKELRVINKDDGSVNYSFTTDKLRDSYPIVLGMNFDEKKVEIEAGHHALMTLNLKNPLRVDNKVLDNSGTAYYKIFEPSNKETSEESKAFKNNGAYRVENNQILAKVNIKENNEFTAIKDAVESNIKLEKGAAAFEIAFDKDNYDYLLGKVLYFYEKGSSIGKGKMILPTFEKPEQVILSDEKSGTQLVSDTSLVSKDAKLIVKDIVDDEADLNDAYTVFEKYVLNGSVKNHYMYHYSLENPDKSKEVTLPGQFKLKFRVPSDWNAENVRLYEYDKMGHAQTKGKIIKEKDGTYFVAETNHLENYILYEIKDIDTPATGLENGTYEVPVFIHKIVNKEELSMADQAIDGKGRLVVNNGKKTLFLNFIPVQREGFTGYLTHMWRYNEDVKLDSYGVKEGTKELIVPVSYYRNEDGTFMTDMYTEGTINYFPEKAYINLVSDEASWPVKVRVPVMDAIAQGDGSQDAFLTIDYANAKKISAKTSEDPLFEALKLQIARAESVVEENYTKASYAEMKKVLERAKAIKEGDDAARTESVRKELTDKLEGLNKYASPEKEALDTAISKAETEVKKTDVYTLKSIENLQNVIDKAKEVFGDKNASAEEIKKAVSDLETAIKGLELKADDKLDIHNLEDGTYIIHGNMVKTDKVTSSMSDNAINHNVMLTVKDGRYYITLDFKGIKIGNKFGYLGELEYFLSGYEVNQYGKPIGKTAKAEVELLQLDKNGNVFKDQYGTDYPDKVTFELIPEALNDGFVPLKVFVPVMESIAQGTGTQEVFLKLAWNTIEKTTTDDDRFTPEADDNDVVNPNEKPENKPAAEPENKPGAESETPETGDENNMLPWMALALAAGIAVAVLRKKED